MSNGSGNFHTYLPISENNMRWDIYLTGAGVATIPPQSQYPLKGHPELYNFRWKSGRVLPEYQILLITEGSGTFESSQTSKVTVEAGSIILLFPGIWHRYKPSKEHGWKEYWLSWNGERLYRLLKNRLLNPEQAVLSLPQPDQVLTAFERILDHIQAHPAENSNVLSAYAMEVLTLALENVETNTVHKDTTVPTEYAHSIDDPIVFKALQIIWNHSYRDFRVNDIVKQLPVSRRTLERKFISCVKYRIRSEITRCRIERAKHLLINTGLPIKHIAFSVGFSSSDRMGKVFQQQLDTTPGQYRKKSRRSDHLSSDAVGIQA
jgi:AraC-like DNA-binding protein